MSTKLKDYIFREATRSDIQKMKWIRDHVTENVLVSMKIEASDYEQALFIDGKGWVCLFEDEVVGFSCGRLKQKDVWALFIDQTHEGIGIGNRLMEMLEDWMFSSGCEEIGLTTSPDTRAEMLYRRRGWQDEGRTQSGEIKFSLKRPSH